MCQLVLQDLLLSSSLSFLASFLNNLTLIQCATDSIHWFVCCSLSLSDMFPSLYSLLFLLFFSKMFTRFANSLPKSLLKHHHFSEAYIIFSPNCSASSNIVYSLLVNFLYYVFHLTNWKTLGRQGFLTVLFTTVSLATKPFLTHMSFSINVG